MQEPEFIYFPLVPGTKRPAIPKWQLTRKGQYKPEGDYAIALEPNILVLDFDPRNYPLGRNLFSEFFSRFAHIKTRVIETPRGGYHVYFYKPPSVKVRKSQPNYPGIDFLSEKHFVCGPGTHTFASDTSAEGVYKSLGNGLIAEFPRELLAELVAPTEADEKAELEQAVLTCESDFIVTCQTYPPAIQGQRGNETTFKLASIGFEYGLPEVLVYQHMRDHYNPNCVPQWDEPELYTIVKNAAKYMSNAKGGRTPESRFSAAIADDPPPSKVVSMFEYKAKSIMDTIHPAEPVLDKKGNLVDVLSNVVLVLNQQAEWRDMFAYNEFSNELELTRIPPWRPPGSGKTLESMDIYNLQAWFSGKQMELPEAKIWAALNVCARRYHPVRQYLEKLKWDGIPRLDKILIDTVSADDTPLNRQIGKNLIIGAVKRVFEPGCQLDTVVILEGVQGTYKSSWVRVLGGEWYSASELIRGDKDTFQNLRGRWFVELPEINSTFTKHDFNWLKGVITSASDVYRPSYGRTSVCIQRQSVFVGTINPAANATYLKDEENRRYLPVKTGVINLSYLREMRDQYFAEAVERYKRGEECWISDNTILAAARKEQEARREKDPLVDILRDWVKGRTETKLTEVYAALGYGTKVKPYDAQRVGSALKDLGYTFNRTFGGGGIWQRELSIEDFV